MDLLVLFLMDRTVDLDRDAQVRTIEIHYVSRDDVLSPELEAEAAPVPEQLPGVLLRHGRRPPHLPGQLAQEPTGNRASDTHVTGLRLRPAVSRQSHAARGDNPQCKFPLSVIRRGGQGVRPTERGTGSKADSKGGTPRSPDRYLPSTFKMNAYLNATSLR